MINSKKLEKFLIVLVVLCLFIASLTCSLVWTVNAGSYKDNVVDSDKGFSGEDWNINGSDFISLSNDKIKFNVTENKTVAVIARTKAVDNTEYFKDVNDVLVFNADFTFNATDLNGDFAFLFAVPNSTDGYGVKNSSAVIFSLGNSNIQIRVSSFELKNIETSKLIKQNLGENVGLNEPINVVIEGYVKDAHSESPVNKVRAYLGENLIFDVEVPSVFGYVGFGCPKGGTVGLDVNKCKIYFQKYINASTTSGGDVWSIADFNSGDYNLNEWYAEAFYGYFNSSGLTIDNGKLVLDSTGMASFSTKYQYSNFQLQFNISDLITNAVHTENHNGDYIWTESALGQYKKLVSCGFYVTLGALEYTGNGISAPYLYIQPFYGEDYTAKNSKDDFTKKPDCTRLVFNDGKQTHYYKLDKNLWDDDVTSISFEVKQIDGVLSFIYSTDSGDMGSINNLKLEVTPYGYVKILTKGHPSYTGANLDRYGLSQRCKQASFSIDYVKIKNLDIDAEDNIITIGYQTSFYERNDYIYQDTWDPNDLLGR